MDLTLTNKNDLRVIKTVYDTMKLNSAQKDGHHCLIKKIERTGNLYSYWCLFRNYKTGEYEFMPSRKNYVQYGEEKNYPEEEWEIIEKVKFYNRVRNSSALGWAAYIIPKDAKVGERFYIEDIIEDILMEHFWSSKFAATDGECIWNGNDIEIDKSLYDRTFLIG